MFYLELVELYEKLSKTTKKLEKTKILSEFLRKLKEPETIYLLKGRIFPDYVSKEIGISDKLTIKAISKSSGVKETDLFIELRKIGDLGKLAEKHLSKRKQSTLFSARLTIKKVMHNLRKLVEIEGKGAIEKKLSLISELLNSAEGKESKYIVRTLLSDLRIGVSDGIIRDSISEAFFPNKKEAIQKIEDAYNISGDYALVYKKAKEGIKFLEKLSIVPGKPLKVMLPVKVTKISEAFRICGKPAAIEHKYDGFRALISKDANRKISLFTRRLEDVTNQFPDIVEIVKKNVKAETFIIDTEVVGFDFKTKKYLPFESISQRIKRKYNIKEMVKKLPVEINVFDILYLNGKSLVKKSFIERRKRIEKIIKSSKLKIRPSMQFITDDEKKALKFYEDALKKGEEGIMVKKLDAPYQPGRRIGYMVKMKPDLKDFDLVIVGAEYGSGKRGGWLTSYIVACKRGDDFLEVGKVSSGLKEKISEKGTTYNEMTSILEPLITKKKGKEVKLKPRVVVSVTYQNIQKSSAYSSGFALRFPRITHYRPDRKPYDITTLSEIKKAFEKS